MTGHNSNNKKTRKRYSRLIDQRNDGEQEQEEQEQKEQQQNKETELSIIDDHILRIKRALNEFVDEVEERERE
jgi:hypothetical protein